MRIPPVESTPFSVGRAFVVQFADETDAAAAQFSGRVEHIASGEAGRFASLSELLDFIGRWLTRAASDNDT